MKQENFSVGYEPNGPGRSSVWVPVEWYRLNFNVRYQSNGPGRSSVWVADGMSRTFFSVGPRRME